MSLSGTESDRYKGKEDFTKLLTLRNQLFVAAKNFIREDNLSFTQIARMSNGMDEQLKLARKVIDVVDRPDRVIFLRLSCVIRKANQRFDMLESDRLLE